MIVQEPNPVLRKKAEEIPLEDITKPIIKKVLQDMFQALDATPDGVALAAPQIGISYRIFIISGKVFKNQQPIVCINPTIISHSRKKIEMPGEGCLSVRYKYGTTLRYKKATIHAYDEFGQGFELSGTGLLAQIFQHEIDHLDGILFIDHAQDIKQMTEEEIATYFNNLK